MSIGLITSVALEKICGFASGRKYATLRNESKELLDRLPQLLGERAVVQSVEAGEAVANGDATADTRDAAPFSDDDAHRDTTESAEAPRAAVSEAAELPATLSNVAEATARVTMQDDVLQPLSPRALSDEAALGILNVLRQAIETRKTALVEVALDLIQRLIAHQALRGRVYTINHHRDSTAAPTKSKRRVAVDDDDDDMAPDVAEALPPQAQAVELLCRCYDIPDDGVELRVLKGLLTAITSNTIHVHGQALLLAVRTSYNTFLQSKSEVNQTTAKASLTQMVNVVFQRMEHNSETTAVAPIVVSDVLGMPPVENSSVSMYVQNFLQEVVSAVDPFGTYASEVEAGLDDAFSHGLQHDTHPGTPLSPAWGSAASPRPFTRSVLPAAAEHRSANSQLPAGADDSSAALPPAQQLHTAGEAIVTSEVAAPAETDSKSASAPAHDAVPNGDSSQQPTEALHASSAADATALVTTAAGATGDPARLHGTEEDEKNSARAAALESVLQKDAFVVFRALCKLTIKTADSGADVTATRGKVLALELLKVLLENSGPVFASSAKFMDGIKQYLCLSLLKNCASSNSAALRLSCSIFLTLVAKFRHALKAEVGVFFPMILLRSIEPASSASLPSNQGGGRPGDLVDMAQRAVVLRCLEAQCADGQLLVDLFVNYDCDLEGANLFERMAGALVRIAQTPVPPDLPQLQQEDERLLRVLALQCCVNILRSLVQWYNQTVAAAAAEQLAAQSPGVALVGGGDDASDDTSTDLTSSAGGKDAVLLESWKAHKTGFQQGVALFNKNPKKGIAFMQEHSMVGKSPEDIAKFLAKTSGLEKTVIGEYLGEREDTALAVMHAYVDAMDFVNLEFDNAIRKFLDGFRLPGEAQKIDRLMEKFAERFVHCNSDTFKSADVAYVLAYSVIMLNTDAHNPGVKVKMSKEDFLRNNRGINDGGDLPVDFMEALYLRITTNEIKMKDNLLDSMKAKEHQAKAVTWMDSILSLVPGRKQALSSEPSDEAVKRTHDYLRDKAKGATFFSAVDGDTVRPMLDVSWAPFMGAFSVLFEEFNEGTVVGLCLGGFVAAINLTSLLNMGMLRNAYVTSLARFTSLHAPSQMSAKSAKAFRSMLFIAEDNGNNLHDVWPEVLRCVSRFELLTQMANGCKTDMELFNEPEAEAEVPSGFMRLRRGLGLAGGHAKSSRPEGDSGMSSEEQQLSESAFFQGPGGKGRPELMPPAVAILREVDPQEMNRIFVRSERLNSEAIVEFVRALCTVAREELRVHSAPRVYSLNKIVEISHYNMGRIRLVWSRIWAVLADFFVEVGCHPVLKVAMYGVDTMRQLAMKFLERDELANFSFQNDFLKPFVVVMRQSKSVEIRELIIRCVSQMVLARVGSIKSGWKSMFMVFTTAASDEDPNIVEMAFVTIEKIVREHFHYITETEITTFTDCVNCLIAYTNNPHSLNVALNAIAFLRFCAMKLADGDIGDTERLPEGTALTTNLGGLRLVEAGTAADASESPDASRDGSHVSHDGTETPPQQAKVMQTVSAPELAAVMASSPAVKLSPTRALKARKGLCFTDRDEHMYFWFPLLAGLSELTFDPRPDVRYTALEVLFDTLTYHGGSFTPEFWTRIFDSVLLTIFDHVRAEVTDTTTFTNEVRRAEEDAWLYDTCTQCLQHLVDLVVLFYPVVQPLMSRILALLENFMRRPHESLAAVGVAAFARLVTAAGGEMSVDVWSQCMTTLSGTARVTLPQVAAVVSGRPSHEGADSGALSDDDLATGGASSFQRASMEGGNGGAWGRASLLHGSGARRLGMVRVRAAVQLLLVQACGQIYEAHSSRIPQPALEMMLKALQLVSKHAREVDDDMELRRALAFAQAEDQVPVDRALGDPPLLRLESEASHAYLSMLLSTINSPPGDGLIRQQHPQPDDTRGSPSRREDLIAKAEDQMVIVCTAHLLRFQNVKPQDGPDQPPAFTDANGMPLNLATNREEFRLLAPLVVATLQALYSFSDTAFRTHLSEFFPLLTELIGCEHAPPEVQVALSKLFSTRMGPLLGQGA